LFNLSKSAIEKFNKKTALVDVDDILVYPVFKNKNTLMKFLNKIIWYLPETKFSNFKVHIFINEFDFNINQVNIDLEGQYNYINNINKIGNIEISRKENMGKLANQSDLILIYDFNYIENIKLRTNLSKSVIVDEDYYSTIEASNFCRVFDKTLSKKSKEKLYDLSSQNFSKLKKKNKEKSYVFCTGPSIEKAYNYDFNDGFNVICNSIVKNDELMDHIQPDLLTFADPVFHFGPSRYAERFRKMMIEAVRKYDLFVAVPDGKASLLLAHYPELENRIIITRKADSFNFPKVDNIRIRGTSNILTLFMLPFASSLSNEIYLIGCDGREEGEDYFWEHNPEVQFEGLKETAFKTHPSFFRDRIYTDYYKQHCETLENLLEYGGKKGKEYYSLTESYIPALKRRHVDDKGKLKNQ
ncbi:MAG: hypothetical protein ACOC1K_08165, partial [Nanoarchaeota archaeon]